MPTGGFTDDVSRDGWWLRIVVVVLIVGIIHDLHSTTLWRLICVFSRVLIVLIFLYIDVIRCIIVVVVVVR